MKALPAVPEPGLETIPVDVWSKPMARGVHREDLLGKA